MGAKLVKYVLANEKENKIEILIECFFPKRITVNAIKNATTKLT